MRSRRRPAGVLLVPVWMLLAAWLPAAAQTNEIEPEPCVFGEPPGEVSGLLVDHDGTLSWQPEPCSNDYNVYRGTIGLLRSGVPARCHADEVPALTFGSPDGPSVGQAFLYLVTGENSAGEGTPGSDSSDLRRPLLGSCDAVVRRHVLDRVGYGGDEWSRDRIGTLGVQGYLDEQLDPGSIDESTNTELIDRKAGLEPPETIQELQSLDIVQAVYARRQLEQQATMFWTNHFNTFYGETVGFFGGKIPDVDERRATATLKHHEEMERFRNLAFDGNFREILEASSLGPAMLIFLDTVDNVDTAPNENYSRELLELHTMGVTEGFDTTIVELAKVYTGWTVCKKAPPDIDDYLAPCLQNTADPGEWVAHFRTDRHDCTEKILFTETDTPLVIPDTCATPDDGVNDVFLAMDAIALRRETRGFQITRLLQKFVTEEPTSAMILDVASVWNDATNPHGVGDLREVLRAVLAQADFRSPDSFGNKAKTPYELIASGFRAVRGMTIGNFAVRQYMDRMRQSLHQNPVPTGYAEGADAWIDTSNILERQAFVSDMTLRTGSNFGADVIGLLVDSGVPVTIGNETAIVDFYIDVLFGGALTPEERQDAIDFLVTDDAGNPDPDYDRPRIRNTVGLMMGLGQFQEQ